MIRRLIVLLTLVTTLGCQPRPPASPASTRPIATATEFAGPGVRLTYPTNWSAAPSDEFVLRIVPSQRSPTGTAVSLDVPKLPPHIPGLIPLGSVVNGYVDDLRKQHPGVEVNEPVPMTAAGAKARRVRSEWTSDGAKFVEEAILTVHGDRVYIFRANTDAAGEHNARVVLNSIVDSVQWE